MIIDSLTARRKQLGLYQKDVAASIHATRPAVSQWESGKRSISLRDAEAYARALGMKLELS